MEHPPDVPSRLELEVLEPGSPPLELALELELVPPPLELEVVVPPRLELALPELELVEPLLLVLELVPPLLLELELVELEVAPPPLLELEVVLPLLLELDVGQGTVPVNGVGAPASLSRSQPAASALETVAGADSSEPHSSLPVSKGVARPYSYEPAGTHSSRKHPSVPSREAQSLRLTTAPPSCACRSKGPASAHDGGPPPAMQTCTAFWVTVT
jgi:hypothetical protein